MTAREALRFYVRRLRQRLLWGAALRGTALLCTAALFATVLLTLLLNRLAFSSLSLYGARGVLLAVLACAALIGLLWPLARLTLARSAARAERVFPQFGARLLTFAERDGERDDPFLELLAADTLQLTKTASARSLVPDAALVTAAVVALACAGVLLWLVRAGPGYLGYGAAALWQGTPAAPFYDIRVSPGDATVRRHADELITAQALGTGAPVQLYARYANTRHWERLVMQPQPQSSGFQFLFAGIAEDLEYYARAGSVESRHYRLRVADAPGIRHIRVTYHFPAWMKRADVVDDHGGDLRAEQGTEAHLSILTDRPLAQGALALDDGEEIALASEGAERYRATITLERDGAYHLAAREHGRSVRLSEDYFIEAGEVRPPQVTLVRPVHDYRASPIEEVAIAAQAADAFGLEQLAIHYAVNGGPEKVVELPVGAGGHDAQGSTMLALDDFQLVPGDIVSLYASARDARAEAHTDMDFIQIEPFEREFSQSQQSGGGGGGAADNQGMITQREKEIIAATWTQSGVAHDLPQHAAEQAKFLSDVQSTLRSQSLSLAGRLRMRDLTLANEHFDRFQQEMMAAAEAMAPASQKLAQQHFGEALPDEQKALQHLMRAEATFRQIEVAFGALGSGSAGSAGRDLASLFDLELDTEKNQYETRQSSAGETPAQRVDDALRKLDELARRQDALAAQRANAAAQSAQQRWQQEMLRREAEQVRRQLEQLAQESAGADGAAQDSAGQAGSSSAGERERARQALERLTRAQDAMRGAVEQSGTGDAARAAEQLREALGLLGGLKQQEASHDLDALRNEADRLASTEREQAQKLEQARSGGAGSGFAGVPQMRGYGADVSSMIEPRQRLADDLSRLEAQLREAERHTLDRSRAAASKLREALGDLDESDAETRLQRSADLMRRGYNPGGGALETQIASALQRLTEQLGEAQQALGREAPQTDPLDTLAQLRGRLAALDPEARAPGQGRGNASSSGAPANAGAAQGPGAVRGGAVTAGGGGTGQRINGGWNFGANTYGPGRAAAPQSGPAGDPERAVQQGLADLSQLRRAEADDPEARRQVDALIREMQQLDPRRFPGNPTMVSELYARVLSQVDQLELQLRHDAAQASASEVRGEEALPVPAGYQDAVAEYFRRLSKLSPQ
jgi:hypothetical protein